MPINQQFYGKKTDIEKNLIAEERCFGDSHLNIDGSSDLENAKQNGNLSQQDMVNFGGKSIIQHQQIDIEDVERGDSVRISPNYGYQENQLDSMKTLSKQKSMPINQQFYGKKTDIEVGIIQ
ncbi:hypothetical protein L3Y34_011423 [Caenorhabditis briggsae]|uniref:Uncharacterized protein n=1 Tax=Caenorhabditis briggsae TaxID=6238 RepID=A0AAE9CUF5_CAEBR|nr:hypothetical protein L3Y34_011423 [Caenorhabditis briggsae]